MIKLLVKYASAVTAAKKSGAQTKDAMIVAAKATLTEDELALLGVLSMPQNAAELEDAAWAGQTYRQAFPERTGLKSILDAFDAALTPLL